MTAISCNSSLFDILVVSKISSDIITLISASFHLECVRLYYRTYANPGFLPFVGRFSPGGRKTTYERRKVPCCRRLQSLLRKSYYSHFYAPRSSSPSSRSASSSAGL